jgi:hypothetical protein
MKRQKSTHRSDKEYIHEWNVKRVKEGSPYRMRRCGTNSLTIIDIRFSERR